MEGQASRIDTRRSKVYELDQLDRGFLSLSQAPRTRAAAKAAACMRCGSLSVAVVDGGRVKDRG